MKTIDQPTQVVDEVIAEVRRHKLAIAEEHNFDVELLLQSLQARQTGDPRIVNLTKGEHAGANRQATLSESESEEGSNASN